MEAPEAHIAVPLVAMELAESRSRPGAAVLFGPAVVVPEDSRRLAWLLIGGRSHLETLKIHRRRRITKSRGRRETLGLERRQRYGHSRLMLRKTRWPGNALR